MGNWKSTLGGKSSLSIITFSILSRPPSRLDKALSRDAPAQAGLSRTRLTRLITGGHIQIDGKIELNPSSKVAEGADGQGCDARVGANWDTASKNKIRYNLCFFIQRPYSYIP